MIRYLVDTNVISETARPKPDANVTRWLGQLSTMTLPAIAVYEIASGIERLAAGKRREFLKAWLAELLASDCECFRSIVARHSLVRSWNRKLAAGGVRSSYEIC